jgi:crotonobetainyl-CoA:carnitine CoA-transferase CaiB-like acyl-CoA transferase
MPLPLEGIRVLDMSVFQQGTYASAMLADMGADVVKIEAPDHPDPGRGTGLDGIDGKRPYFEHLNRNKRGISLDLKSEAGRAVFLHLIDGADIFHNNMRPGVLERLGLTYDTLSDRNPRIIVSQATGWGHLGPDAEAQLGSMDVLAQARGGIMSVTGTPETGPMPVGVPFADHVGAITSAYGMMVALWERERSGRGQMGNTSLYGAQLTIEGYNITAAMWQQRDPALLPPEQRRPHWTSYRCGDDRLLMVGGGTPDRWWGDFCEVLGVPEFGAGTYSVNALDAEWRERAIAALNAVFATQPREHWLALLQPRFLVQPVSTYLDIAEDPQAWANGYLTNVPVEDGEPKPTVGVPVNLSRTPGSVRHFAPELGQHTEEVLLEAGLEWAEIEAYRDRGAFGADSAPADAAAPR